MTKIFTLGVKFRPLEDRIKKTTEALLRLTERTGSYVEVFLVGSEFMKEHGTDLTDLYKKSKELAHGKNEGMCTATDTCEFNVLAFQHPEQFPRPDVRGDVLGEIYLNPDYINKHGESLTQMLIHGFLHLVGYDHKKNDDRLIMEKEENALWHKISSQD